MAEGYPRIQFSRMVGKDQIVLRGDDPDEVSEMAKGMAKVAEDVAEALNVVQQVAMAVDTFKGGDNKSSSTIKSDAPNCEHGERIRRTGANWGAYFCPEKDKDDQCEPIWDKKKK